MEQIMHIIEQVQIDLDGKNLVYNFDDFRDYVDNSKLSDDEKSKAIYGLIRQRDIQNLIWYKRLEYECSVCNYKGRTTLTCERCIREHLVKQFGKWTTGDKELDREIQVIQSEVPYPLLLVEWIPIEELTNIEPLDSGAFSEIFSATWTKGLAYDFRDNQLIREKDTEVSLKKIPKNFGYKEIVINLKAKRAGFGVVPCYGITYNEEGYMLVLMRMVKNMSNYLEENRPLSCQQIDNILWSLSSRLYQLHRANIIHNDLHLGNFMIGKGEEWNLIDLGLSPIDENRSHGDSDNKESDIYAFAATMCEVIVGNHPRLDDSDRPILPMDIPEDYRKIIEMCLDPEPNKRPKSESLVSFFRDRMKECT